jgi:YidC/Oxa1 family membrane protein insertase
MQPLLAAAVAKAGTVTNACVGLSAKQKTSDHSIFSPIAKPIADVLAAFYAVIPNYGVDIILLSVAWMVIIAPLTLKSTRSMLAMQKVQPQLKKLQAEHKNDRQAFAQAQMELFKEHNVSPFGSCLPTLLPLPVFFALFRVIDGLSHKVTVTTAAGVKSTCAVPSFLSSHTEMYKAIQAASGHINAFGLDLSKNALSGHSSFAAAIPFYILLLIMIGTQYLQTAQMMSRNPAANDNPQMKMMKYLPIFFGVICVRFPAGVILYYAMSNVCRMAQQTAMYRYDPKVKALVAAEVIEVEAVTRDIDRKGSKAAKKVADSPPARSSRFRDALAQASKQATEARDNKKGAATPPAKAKPPAVTTRPANKSRPNGSGPAPAKGVAKKPAPGRPAGAASNGAAKATNGNGSKSAGNGSGNGSAAGNGRTNGNDSKSAGNGNGSAAGNGRTNGNGSAAGNGRTNGNGTGKPVTPASGTKTASSAGPSSTAPDPVTPDSGSSTNGGQKPSRTGAGSGRTGAGQSGTPRKRRSR